MRATWIFSFVRFVLVAALGATVLLALAQAPAPNQAVFQYKGADREARLIEKAKQEGIVTVYTSLAPTEAKPLVAAFEKKTGIKVNMWRGLSDGVVQRVLSEARANLNAVDVIETNGPEMEALAREQLLAAIHSPYLADVPSALLPKHGQWIPDRMNFYVVAYNTNKVRREDLPKTYEGFLDPKWKGRIALEATDSEWMAGVVKTWGEGRGMSFFNKLSDMKPDLRKGHVLLVNLISSGEIDAGLTAYQSNASSAKRRGAPVDWAPVEPVIAKPQGVGVARLAPHPNAALLFADFMLSPQAQELLAGMGRGPVSSKVKSETSSMNYLMSDPSVVLDQNDKWEQLWNKAFLGK
ncbi:MAG: ABC transporter substrate-binding protein [Burkholderiales bacterium RIFCSPHIGHO2_12_FULL_61_11]|nr:MAG: ABC transporter substrate-binding protein [Burkholderiales bacterium RIFCSPHIGHO2_12_FULL_61_11]